MARTQPRLTQSVCPQSGKAMLGSAGTADGAREFKDVATYGDPLLKKVIES